MKGNKEVIKTLNALLADELTAISQYIVHAEMCENWGYGGLHGIAEGRSIDEMKHAEKLICRVLYLEGTPIVSKLNPMAIGAAVDKQVANDLKSEYDAVKSYNAGVKLCAEAGDNGTREMLVGILKDEEAHVDVLEAQGDQIAQMGIQNYLAQQIK